MNLFTTKEAYEAMIYYLEHLYSMTKSDDLGGFLGGMSLLDDGETADPAAWKDWMVAINKVKKDHLDN
jgi:hypothetical protein